MYLIANKTDDKIEIPDLNLILGKNQAIDLHKLSHLAIKPEDSKDLRARVKTGALKLLRKSNTTKQVIEPKVQEGLTKEEIAQILREELKNNKPEPGPAPVLDNTEIIKMMHELSKTVKELASRPPQQVIHEHVSKQEEDKQEQEQDEIGVSSDILADIHAKAIDKKMTGNSSIHIEQEKTEDDGEDFLSNASELEDIF